MRASGAALAALLAAASTGMATGARAQPPAPDRIGIDWSGLYLGGHFGGAFGSSDWFDLGAGDIGSHNPGGILGGGQIGYNFQNGPWVFGPQASISRAGIDGQHLDAVFQFGPAPEYDKDSIDWTGTLTARLGYAAGPWLVYGSGGLAWASARYSLVGFFAPNLEFAAGDGGKWGWTAGAGVAYAFTPRWSGFLEYDHLDFGSEVATLSCTAVPNCGPPGANAVAISIRESLNVIKTGINFRF
jgi:opacity protein-like surface antigen